ncbi:MAG: ribonuclease H-like domain-containing protein [Candidatus Omnitrophota bacterium]|nr:MAG: ribonuclease H-like domain-containing protein [Candidatus Omnitrophota bacterium]
MNLKKSIEEIDLVFFDLETTGLKAEDGDSICEIGALKVRTVNIIDKFYSLVNPKKSVPYEAYRIHKISDEELHNAPYFEEVIEKFLQFLHNSVVCAYNAEFDMDFLNQELSRIHYPPLELPVLDILSMARKTIRLPRYNLAAIISFFHIETKASHRALEDAYGTLQAFFKLKETVKGRGLDSLQDFISLYGLNNKVFRLQEKPKILLLKEAITKGVFIDIRYFSYESIVEHQKVKPIHLSRENNNFYLWCRSAKDAHCRIQLNRILAIDIV